MEGSTWMVFMLAFLVSTPVALGTDHTVGGSSGWTLGVDYENWASGTTFKAGDTLTFNYGSSHSVYQLPSKSDYDGCDLSNNVYSSSSSPTKITLGKAGTTYFFVCGIVSHCQGGMKLSVTTAAGSGESSPPPSKSPSPPSTTPSPPAGSNTPPSTTAPSPSSSPVLSAGSVRAMVGALVVGIGLLG